MAAGYSGTPLVRKLGVKPGHVVVLVGAPAGWQIEGLPETARESRVALEPVARAGPGAAGLAGFGGGRADVVLAFVTTAAALRAAVAGLAEMITPDGALWVAWPRRAGGHASDVTDNGVRGAVLPQGLVDVKVAALDSDWSGLKLVWRKELRPGLAARG